MAIKVNARKNSWWWKWFHTCEFELVEEVHYWLHECKRGHPRYPNAFNRWYQYTIEVSKCKHCHKINKRKYDNIVLPRGGRDACSGTIY